MYCSKILEVLINCIKQVFNLDIVNENQENDFDFNFNTVNEDIINILVNDYLEINIID